MCIEKIESLNSTKCFFFLKDKNGDKKIATGQEDSRLRTVLARTEQIAEEVCCIKIRHTLYFTVVPLPASAMKTSNVKVNKLP